MTLSIDDLMKLYDDEYEHRDGIRAVVTALRDETCGNIKSNQSAAEAWAIFEAILGEAGEKVAEGIAERADEQRADAPATDPIRNAVAMARGRALVVDDIPMLNKLAATMSPATDLTVGQRLIKAAKEAAAIARGEVSDPSYTGGMNDLCVTDAAPACEWRVGKDPAGYSCYYSDCTAGWRGLRANFCPTCKRPVKIVEPEPDPAPAVCVWTGEEYVTYSTSCESEHEVDPHKAPPTYCPSCGLPIKFTEAK